jgi:cytochrome b561
MTQLLADERMHYTAGAKLAHWLIAVLVAVQYYAGLNMGPLEPGMPADALANLHVTVGPVILVLAAWRLIVRLREPVAQLPDIPVWQQKLASLTHTVLYVLLVVIPPLGVLAAQNEGALFRVLGVIPLPSVIPPGSALGEFGETAHVLLALFVLPPLLALHIAAALYHWMIRRDRVMQRMLPGS